MTADIFGHTPCIVSYGCALPDAPDPETFWDNLLAGRCSIREIPDTRWNKSLYYRPEGGDPDFTRVAIAAFVENRYLNTNVYQGRNRLHHMTLHAADQMMARLPIGAFSAIAPSRVQIFLGCMECDERLTSVLFPRREMSHIRDHILTSRLPARDALLARVEHRFARDSVERQELLETLFTSSVLVHLRSRYGWMGESGLLDAACASSLAALGHAMQALQNGQADLVISGGIESHLGPEAFALFSVLGALSPEPCLPFDRRGKGLSLGEGAVIFALERLEDALRFGHPIHGILQSVGSSSDGRGASLFAPSPAGQKRAYEQAYAGLEVAELTYLECHGTGTRVGDEIELRSVYEHFRRSDLPIGSAKSLVGHAKGAAGAIGVLKCLLSMQHRVCPPSRYFREPLLSDVPLFINTEPLPLPSRKTPLMMGVSAFGFGGINYHVVLGEYRPKTLQRRERRENVSVSDEHRRVTVNADQEFSWERLQNQKSLDQFSIPPTSRPRIDMAQIGALMAVDETSRNAGIDWSRVDPKDVLVIAAGCLGLDKCLELGSRLRYAELRGMFPELSPDELDSLVGVRNRYVSITPDSSAGVLNNVVAGRVANVFNFHGLSMSVDADFNSPSLGLSVAVTNLSTRPGVAVVLALTESLEPELTGVRRSGIRCWILSTEETAWKYGLPVLATVREMTIETGNRRAES